MADNQTYYDALIARHKEIERKGKTMPYTSLNGHMFTFLSKEGEMGLRLSREDLEEFMQTYQTSRIEQHGRVMKEYALVPENMLKNDPETLSKYIEKSWSYVNGLKPKNTKK